MEGIEYFSDFRFIAFIAQLVNPYGAQSKRFCRQIRVFDCTGGVALTVYVILCKADQKDSIAIIYPVIAAVMHFCDC